ncbi:hypothetical protein [Bacillus sp. KH172YL63]|nr:hypothetical protein [Bacillus sp. KH172YL63]BCB05726.1 hypothetical protein KH172YL63_38590 [Bacillus sp. KH172YL63]
MPLLYLKAREAYEFDAKSSGAQVTKMRGTRKMKPVPFMKKR